MQRQGSEFGEFFMTIAFFALLFAGGYYAFTGVYYLYTGQSGHVSTLQAYYYFTQSEWAEWPNSWLGLHTTMRKTTLGMLSLYMAAPSFVLGLLGLAAR